MAVGPTAIRERYLWLRRCLEGLVTRQCRCALLHVQVLDIPWLELVSQEHYTTTMPMLS